MSKATDQIIELAKRADFELENFEENPQEQRRRNPRAQCIAGDQGDSHRRAQEDSGCET